MMSIMLACDPPPAATGSTLMIEQGWRVETPVLARLSWSQQRTGERACQIMLSRASQCSLVVIADSRAIHDFLATLSIPVV